jgi:hypothetical protein
MVDGAMGSAIVNSWVGDAGDLPDRLGPVEGPGLGRSLDVFVACLGKGGLIVASEDGTGRTGAKVSNPCDGTWFAGELSVTGTSGPYWLLPSLRGNVTAWEIMVTESSNPA